MNFVIYSPDFDETSGGALAMHYLCHYLNEEGFEAYIYPKANSSLNFANHSLKSVLRRYYLRWRKKAKKRSELLNTPLINKVDFNNSIVIYPEKTDGNPLKAKKVVRYLLHKPGFHTGKVELEPTHLFLYYRSLFLANLNGYEKTPRYPLFLFVILDNIYFNKNYSTRSGTCFIVRKGARRKINHNLSEGIVVDNLDHKAMAEVFNRSEYCISYDLDTFYSRYASLCGCISIVVPEENTSKEEWCPDEGMRFGIAYGEEKEELEWSKNTRVELAAFLNKQQKDNQQKVKDFGTYCGQLFKD